uniref:Transmembrane protein 52 n=1 Tax=Terrapene triunguis TaxID=2587831 RepID=A0A674KEV8_9SAUR
PLNWLEERRETILLGSLLLLTYVCIGKGRNQNMEVWCVSCSGAAPSKRKSIDNKIMGFSLLASPRLILLTVFMLLLCGITASCVKFCCRKKRPPVQTFPRRPYDMTVIAVDGDSTAHSTVTSYSSFQYPQSTPLPFGDMDRSTMSPPAYSLYAMELPPSYDEAIKMAKPYIETVLVGQKLNDILEVLNEIGGQQFKNNLYG